MHPQRVTAETVISLTREQERTDFNSVFLYGETAKHLIEKHLEALLGDGVEARVLIPGDSWGQGTIKLHLEFIRKSN